MSNKDRFSMKDYIACYGLGTKKPTVKGTVWSTSEYFYKMIYKNTFSGA